MVVKENRPLRELARDAAAGGTRDYCYTVDRPGASGAQLHIPETGVRLRFSEVDGQNISSLRDTGHDTAFFDMVMLRFPLIVRNFRPGDRFTPLGMIGSQKVKKYFINSKIEREIRAACPILLTRGKIAWVVGHRIDESFRVGPGTEKLLLKVELLLA